MTATVTHRPSLIARGDTLLGVCEGLGEDLGINANWFRIAFALALFWSPVGAIATYLAAGAVVMLTRLLFPAPKAAEEVVARPAAAGADNDESEELPLAA